MGIVCCFVGVILVTWHDELVQQQEQGQAGSAANAAAVTDSGAGTGGALSSMLSMFLRRVTQSSSGTQSHAHHTEYTQATHRSLKIDLSNTGGGTAERGLVGDAASLLSAMLYGYYTVILRMNVSEGEGEGVEGSGSGQEVGGGVGAGVGISTCDDAAGSRGSSSSSSSILPYRSPLHSTEDAAVESFPAAVSVAAAAPPEIPLGLVLGYVGLLVTLGGLPVLLACSAYCLESLCRYVCWCVLDVEGWRVQIQDTGRMFGATCTRTYPP